jgi:hypothetical protein
MIYALRRSVDKLLKYYEGLEPSSATHEHLHSSVFPSISPFHDKTGNTITFKYIRPLEDDPACITFHAKTTGSSPIDVVVKFVERYGEDAHRLLADNDPGTTAIVLWECRHPTR